MEEIKGHIETIVFLSEETGFTVAKLKESFKEKTSCIVGIMPSIQPGETIHCKGEWKHHPTHGKQFEVSTYEVTSPSDLIGIKKYLESGLIKGIGPVFAQKIVDYFGVETLEVIEKTPNRLKEVAGLGKKKIEMIKKCWKEQSSIRDIMIFLRSFDISPSYAQKIYKKYQNHSIEKVKENPYQLARDIVGIGFKIADTIALKMGLPINSSQRAEAAIEHMLWELTNNGHTCYPEKGLTDLVKNLLQSSIDQIDSILIKLEKEKRIVRKKLPFKNQEIDFVFLRSLYFFEQGIANELFRLHNSPIFSRDIDTKKAALWAQDELNVTFAKEQIEAIELAITNKTNIITGGPGTGKSTITKAILKILSKIADNIYLAAPTGRAAKRLTQITKKKAFTIHSLLEFDFHAKGFKRNKHNPLNCSLLIIDEASMIDSLLMYYLLRAIPDRARVIFIGDIDQLPSIGAGYVLKDMIKAKIIPVTHLKKIFRQSKGSNIILNAHFVNKGYFPKIHPNNDSDFRFIEKKEPQEIANTILELVKTQIPKETSLHPIEDIQVLCPMKKGIIGAENFNRLLQDTLNPSKAPFFRAGQRYHLHDKVMQIRNNYNKKVYNGDIGTIFSINLDDQVLQVSYEGKLIDYDFSQLDEITLAYAVSVHKYQGSECPCIVLPIHTSHFKLLQRNLLYTAITRGKKLVILVGTKQAMMLAIKNDEVINRFTGLEFSLKKEFSKKVFQQTLLPGF